MRTLFIIPDGNRFESTLGQYNLWMPSLSYGAKIHVHRAVDDPGAWFCEKHAVRDKEILEATTWFYSNTFSTWGHIHEYRWGKFFISLKSCFRVSLSPLLYLRQGTKKIRLSWSCIACFIWVCCSGCGKNHNYHMGFKTHHRLHGC